MKHSKPLNARVRKLAESAFGPAGKDLAWWHRNNPGWDDAEVRRIEARCRGRGL